MSKLGVISRSRWTVSSPARTRARRTRSAKAGSGFTMGGSAGRLASGPRQGGRRGEREHRVTGVMRERRGRDHGPEHVRPIGGGDWGDEEWTGWWGDDPPYHYPVFIVTHHPRDPVEMEEGPRSTSSPTGSSPRSSGKDAAGGKDVMVCGGADVARPVPGSGPAGRTRAPRRSGGARRRARLLDDLGGRRSGSSRSGPSRAGVTTSSTGWPNPASATSPARRPRAPRPCSPPSPGTRTRRRCRPGR